MVKTLNLKVVGDNKMSCGGCERSVAATVLQLPGVAQVTADHTTQGVAVTLGSDETSLETIARELAEIGYEVAPA